MRFNPEMSKQVGSQQNLRPAMTWDPLLLHLHLLANVFSSNTNKRLKITSCMCSWGKLWTLRYKKTTNQLLLPRCWEQQQWSPTHDSCTRHYQEGVQTTKAVPPAIPTCPNLTSLHLRNSPVSSGNPQGSLTFAWISLLASYQYLWIKESSGLPGSSAGKESTCNAGNPSLIPGFGRSAAEGIGYPLQ